MVELLAILLVVWCVYCFATGKFKPENQRKQKEKLREDLKKIFTQDDVKTEVDSIKKLNPSNQDYRIHYEDFKRDFSVRMISINRLYKENGHWYIDAYCHNACDERTFRVDRIQSLTIEKKNITLFDAVEILDFLKKYF